MTLSLSESSKTILLLLVVVILLPAGYLDLLSELLPNYSLGFVPGFQDSSFTSWNIVNSGLPSATLSVQNGVLSVSAAGVLSNGSVLLAQRLVNMSLNLSQFRYLSIQTRTNSLYVASMLVIWTSATTSYALLLKTYNDYAWHTEIVDLSQFKITSQTVYKIQLGWELLSALTGATASFTQLSISRELIVIRAS